MTTQLRQARVRRWTKLKGWIIIRTNATGSLVRSIEGFAAEDKKEIEGELIALEYWKNLQDKHYSTPPIQDILKWMDARGIPDNDEDDPEWVAQKIIQHLTEEGSNVNYSEFFQVTNKYIDNKLQFVSDHINKDVADAIVEGV